MTKFMVLDRDVRVCYSSSTEFVVGLMQLRNEWGIYEVLLEKYVIDCSRSI